jgi:alpha-tubulin suppressor-like RCC1 family protein
MALRSDGTVWAWGYDGLGQLGNGTSNEKAHPFPVRVANLTGVQAIAAGNNHGLAVRSDGTVWTWGSNTLGQLGAETTSTCSVYQYRCSRIPVRVRNLTGAVAVAGGGEFSLALRTDRTMWGWGDNGYGQLANGTTTPFGGVSTPIKANLTDIVAIAAGNSHSLAVNSIGRLRAAGQNNLGQLGNGTFTDSANAVKVLTVSGVIAIGAGQYHSLAVTSTP